MNNKTHQVHFLFSGESFNSLNAKALSVAMDMRDGLQAMGKNDKTD